MMANIRQRVNSQIIPFSNLSSPFPRLSSEEGKGDRLEAHALSHEANPKWDRLRYHGSIEIIYRPPNILSPVDVQIQILVDADRIARRANGG